MNATPPPVPETKNCGLAIWSLVLGILAIVLSVVCIGPLFAIPAVICGHLAYGRIKRSAGTLSGSGLALGGLITGYVSFALIPVIGLLAAIAIPNFVKARTTAQTNWCVNNLRQIDGAKYAWAMENNAPTNAIPTWENLSPLLGKAANSSLVPQCPAGGAYTIGNLQTAPTCTIPGHALEIDESPAREPRP